MTPLAPWTLAARLRCDDSNFVVGTDLAVDMNGGR